MWRLTEFRSPFVHYKCGCSRQFIIEEMYICVKCQKGLCRFCLEEEIDYFYCKFCNDVLTVNEAQSQKYKCQRLLQCPICASAMSMTMTQPARDDPNRLRYFHYNCLHCQWNTLHIDFKGDNLNSLLIKFNYYKGRYLRSPQQIMYEKLLEIYKYNQEEHIKYEKMVLRSRKKTISYLHPQVTKRTIKYTMDQFNRDQEMRHNKRMTAMTQVQTFEDIYQRKMEAEQLEKARQSQYDGKSPMNMMSASNKGMTPAQKRMFNFDANKTPKGDGASEISQSEKSEMDQSDASAAAYFGQNREIGGTSYYKNNPTRSSLLTPAAGQSGQIEKSFGSMHIKTPSGMDVPKLALDDKKGDATKAQPTTTKNQDKKDGNKKDDDKDKDGKKRQLSDSSRGSIGRKQRLRNALTGRSDGSGDGADQPKELPDSEQIDFLLQYDKTDPFCHKIVIKQVERDDLDSDDAEGPMGDVKDDNLSDAPDFGDLAQRESSQSQSKEGSETKFEGGEPASDEAGSPVPDSSKKRFKDVEEVSFPSLDDALNMKFDLNNVTNMQQRLRNINCQPREIKQLYPAPFHLLTKREKRCKDCHKFIIKPNMNPTSNEKMKADFQMIYYVPKVMIYRIGKYTPYKGLTQEIEMILKFINNEDTQKAKFKLTALEEPNLQDEQDFDQKDLNLVNIPEEGMEFGDDEDGASKITMGTATKNTNQMSAEMKALLKPDKIKVAQTINSDIELPSGFIFIDPKDIIDKGAQGNVLANANLEEKRTKEELAPYAENKQDIDFLYKIVANNTIMKFNVVLKPGFDIEKDEVKFGFNLHIDSKRSTTQTLEMKVPVMINTGKLKLNQSGGNVSSAQSVQSGRAVTREQQIEKQRQQIAAGQAQMLDQSFVTQASAKQALEQSFQGPAQSVASSQMSRQSQLIKEHQEKKRQQLEKLNESYRSSKDHDETQDLNASVMSRQSDLNQSQLNQSVNQSMNQSLNRSIRDPRDSARESRQKK